MNTVKQIVLLTALLVPVAGPLAAIYKSVDEYGNVVYTDEPGADAKPVELPPLSTVPAPKSGTPAAEPAGAGQPAAVYQQITIVSPAPDATIRDNTGAVAISVTTEPALAEGHGFIYYLNGDAQGEPVPSSELSLQNVDRGTHDVEVAVVDASGKELIRSESVRFYLHRQSLTFPTRPTPR